MHLLLLRKRGWGWALDSQNCTNSTLEHDGKNIDDNKITQSKMLRQCHSALAIFEWLGWLRRPVGESFHSNHLWAVFIVWQAGAANHWINTEGDSMRVKEMEHCWWVRGGWFWRNHSLLLIPLPTWLFLDVHFRLVFLHGKTTWHGTMFFWFVFNNTPAKKQTYLNNSNKHSNITGTWCIHTLNNCLSSMEVIMKVKTWKNPKESVVAKPFKHTDESQQMHEGRF